MKACLNIFCIFLFFFYFCFFFFFFSSSFAFCTGTEYSGKTVRISKRTDFLVSWYLVFGKGILFSSFFKCLVNNFTRLSCCTIKIDILGNRKTVLKKSQVTVGYIKINEYAEFLISSLSLLFACPECL